MKKLASPLSPIRRTKIHQKIHAILTRANQPLSARDILKKLEQLKLPVNKTTVYRQLTSLEKKRAVIAVQFDDRNRRYEVLDSKKHHHHAVCLRCGKIEDITIPENFAQIEKTVSRQHRFIITRHALEFFGYCENCAKNIK